MAFLILHGIENHRPPAHWQFQLAARLSERGHEVLYPDLPDPDAPSFTVWRTALREVLRGMSGERVVVCHSLACLLWFKAAASLDRVDRLLLVSPPASERVPEAGASFRLERFDAAAVRASVTGEIAIVCSDDDPYHPDTGARTRYAEPLGVEPLVLPRAGHITPDTGYGRWPAAEEWCDDVVSDRYHLVHGDESSAER